MKKDINLPAANDMRDKFASQMEIKEINLPAANDMRDKFADANEIRPLRGR